MKTTQFFKRDEIKKAKEERRNPIPVFSLTADKSLISQLIVILYLEQEYIFI